MVELNRAMQEKGLKFCSVETGMNP